MSKIFGTNRMPRASPKVHNNPMLMMSTNPVPSIDKQNAAIAGKDEEMMDTGSTQTPH